MLYLIRLAETGREAQPGRRRLRSDVIGELRALLPDADIESDTGRIFVAGGDRRALRRVHGIATFSPCVRCSLEDLERNAVDVARRGADGARTFRVRVKRSGDHDFTSMEKAAALGRVIQQRLPHLSVRMRRPDVVVGVEIRGRDCYLFTEVIPGLDHRSRRPGGERAEPARFLVDQMLGRLVTWLRILGYDTLYVRDEPDSALLRRAREERRVLVTRDRELSRARSAEVLYLEECEPAAQLEELCAALDLEPQTEWMFSRCTLCNREVRPVTKERVEHLLPEVARRLYDEFTWCDACNKLYWKGGQYERILSAVRRLRRK